MSENIKKLIDLTQQAKILTRRIQAEALQGVRGQSIPGVAELTDSSCVVKLSTIVSDKNLTLDPNFYLIEAQVKAIRKKLQLARTFSDMCKAVEDMIDSGAVTINKEKTALHPVVVEALKTSDIGTYITNN